MASSPIPEVVGLRAPQGVHLLLALGIPTLACHLVVYWILGQGPSLVGTLPGTVYTLGMTFWASWLRRTHQGMSLKFWWWSVPTLALYAVLALLAGPPWPLTFTLWGPHLFWFVLALVQGLLAILWTGQLAPRARLYQLIEGIPEGRELEARVRDFQVDADFSQTNLATLTGTLVTLGALAIALATWSPYGRGGLSVGLLAGFLMICLVTSVVLRTYRREMTALMYGWRFTLADKVAPVAWSLGLMVLAGLAAWGLTALVAPWIDWNHLFSESDLAPPPALIPQTPLTPEVPVVTEDNVFWAVLLAFLLRMFRFQNIVTVVSLALQAVVAAAPWAVVAFFLWPLVRWVLGGGRATKGLARKWAELLKAQVQAFWAALAQWGRRSAAFALGSSTPVSNPREWLRSFLVRPAPGRRRPYPEVIEAFLALVRWAEPLTPYHQGETTREFLDRLAALVPDRSSLVETVRDLLDRELFGPSGLDESQRGLFRKTVTTLVSGPASQETPPGVS